MWHLISIICVLAAPLGAAAQPAKDRDFGSLVEVAIEAETGMRMATSVKAAESINKRGYSPGAQTTLIFWVQARKRDSGPTQVVLMGERLRYLVPSEAPKQREFGPSDPAEPAFVGSPWQDADIRYHGSKIECFGAQYWCVQVWAIEVVIPDAVVRSVVAKPSTKDLRLALSTRRRVDWRTPRGELIAVLDKLGVLEEFSAQPAKP